MCTTAGSDTLHLPWRLGQRLRDLDLNVLTKRNGWIFLVCAMATIEAFYLYSVLTIALGILGNSS